MDFKEHPISLAETMRARSVIKPYHAATPLRRYESLSRIIRGNLFIKHENHNPTGTFKIRGSLNLMHYLKLAKIEGVITYSTGNHGTSVATSARLYDLKAVVVVPRGSNPVKVKAIEETGAELIEHGSDFEQAGRKVEELCCERSLYFVHPANEPLLINGVGTEFLEIIEELSGLDVMIVPIGAGSEAAAAINVLKAVKPGVEIIAVQAEASSAAYQSWCAGKITTAENKTFAGGVATGTAYEVPFSLYSKGLDGFILLSEQELYEGIGLAAYHTRNLVEGAGGSCLRAALKIRERLEGKTVAVQMSGANASTEEIIHVGHLLPGLLKQWA
jgi:threonine dehydratase